MSRVRGFKYRTITVATVDRPEGHEGVWEPRLPTHAGGDQHQNVGLDFYSATRVRAKQITTNRFNIQYYEAIIPTGVRIALPKYFHMRIASKSGLGFKRNILAFPGTIDNSYRGQIMIKLSQLTSTPTPFLIEPGDAVAQGIIFRSEDYIIEEGDVDLETPRGEKGFGSTARVRTSAQVTQSVNPYDLLFSEEERDAIVRAANYQD